jgi:hypothetical protein
LRNLAGIGAIVRIGQILPSIGKISWRTTNNEAVGTICRPSHPALKEDNMIQAYVHFMRRTGDGLALAALTICLAGIAHSPAIAADENASVGRIDFKKAELPEANVEIDLSQEMFRDLFGIGDAAIAGVAETLLKSSAGGDSGKTTKLAAEQMEAARQIIQLAGNVVREVRVRVYKDLPDGSETEKLFKPFEEQLQSGNWESLARVRDDENVVRISAVRGDGTLKGLFVQVTDGDNVVIANVVCEVSPDNVKKLTSAATKIGLENGLAAAIEMKMKHAHHGGPRGAIVIRTTERAEGQPPVPPVPPVPPAPVK